MTPVRAGSGVSDSLRELRRARDELKAWLCAHAYPLWWTKGADHVRGGFHERLGLDGAPLEEPRRARVQPRQIHAFGMAPRFGWQGPVRQAVEHGLDFFITRYRRADGLFRTLVAADGRSIDDTAVLYDQAFALLGLAAAYVTCQRRADIQALATDVRERVQRLLRHDQAGFVECPSQARPLSANSHMHLLEASLAWMEVDDAPHWEALAAELVELVLVRLIDRATGAVREYFAADWRPAPGIAGCLIEPGHQFEWAWLLIRWSERTRHREAVDAALRMIDVAEAHGVDPRRGVAVAALLDDMSVHEPGARLWPQTERIKAACRAAVLTGDARHWSAAAAGTKALLKYLDTPLRGLWLDRMNPDGQLISEPVPASSFYHIVGAIAELDQTVDEC